LNTAARAKELGFGVFNITMGVACADTGAEHAQLMAGGDHLQFQRGSATKAERQEG